jgi:glycosyltransferase involved in cell wall biosynthesis
VCRLRAAGYLGRSDEGYLDAIRRRMSDAGLELDYVGEVDRSAKTAFLRTLHVMSVPTVYRESKGLYVLEAMAQGVPVVQPRHGAFPELLEATGGGLLCEPESPPSLADRIASLMDDPEWQHRLGCHGQETVLQSYTDEVMADRTWSFYERVCSSLPPARTL